MAIRIAFVLALVGCAAPTVTPPRPRPRPTPPSPDPVVGMGGFSYWWRCELRRSGRTSCTPRDLQPPDDTVQLDGGCLRTAGGRVLCSDGWEPFTEVAGVSDAVDLSSWVAMSCAVRGDGTVVCWDRDRSVWVVDMSGVSDVEVEGAACAIGPGGGVWCWEGRGRPKRVPDLTDVTQLAVFYDGACALLANRTVECWGDGTYGQLGDGSHGPRDIPHSVMGHVEQLVAGGEGVCALFEYGGRYVACWGGRSWTHHGERPPPIRCAFPFEVVELQGAAWLWMDEDVLCAVDAGGERTCMSDDRRLVELYGAARRAHWLYGCPCL